MAKAKKVVKKKKRAVHTAKKKVVKNTAKKKSVRRNATQPRAVVEKALNAADSFYSNFHWGRDAKSVLKTQVKQIPEVLVSLGELHAIEYKAAKGERGKETYRHVFHKEKPIVCCDPRGRDLYIVGGSYHITERGIEG